MPTMFRRYFTSLSSKKVKIETKDRYIVKQYILMADQLITAKKVLFDKD